MRTDFYIQGIHFYKSVDEKNNETWKLLRLKNYHFQSISFAHPKNMLFIKNCTCPTFSLQT